MAEELAGKTLSKYELRERIGRGGMAEVYRAYHAALDRFVAIKILHPFLGEDPEFKERFEREARSVAQLRHPNIVQVYDFDFDPERELYYMVMEYVEGPTLRTRLMELGFDNQCFTIPEAIQIIRPVAAALGYAHSHNMVHRDIKPANIMLDKDGRIVLTDFGIARIVSGPAMTTSGSMIGTPAYMSPEQGLGQPGDHRSDIYSLGVVFYQLVTGVLPFQAETPIAVVLKHVNEPLPSPSEFNPDIPHELERILMMALAKSPDERYQNIGEMLRDLDEFAAAHNIPLEGAVSPTAAGRPRPALLSTGSRARPEPEPADRRRGQGCLAWLIVATMALAALFGGIYLSYNNILNPLAAVSAREAEAESTSAVGALFLGDDEDEITATPTPDAEATRIVQTLDALSMILSTTSTVEPTPDLTATVRACDYDYELVEQTPKNGSPYPEMTTLTMKLILENDSRCPLDDDTRLVFEDGYQLEGPNFVEFDRELLPGEAIELSLDLRTPAYRASNPTVTSTWLVLLPDGTQVGQPLVIELDIFASVTATPESEGEQVGSDSGA
ncbi:MAG TPA: protein kinase [Aggregatilineales bacterium]|nr:protein kinase [Aggregatilineales bacterium]HQA68906.1 protein kinase [Aggregatilineales bacterium]